MKHRFAEGFQSSEKGVTLDFKLLSSRVEGRFKELKEIKLPKQEISTIEDISACLSLEKLDLRFLVLF